MTKMRADKSSRITVACNACRSRKQKCSGGKPVCQQCLEYNRPCNWPEQLRRGPPKGHIEALEHRLQVTENALLKLLSQVSNAQLLKAFPHHPSFEGEGATYMPLARIQKKGIEDWVQFPLDTAENIRKWQQVCIGQDASGPSHQVLGNEDSSMCSAYPSGRKRKHLALEGTKIRPLEERSIVSGVPNLPHEHEARSSSPVALHPAQKRPFVHVEAQPTPNIIRKETDEIENFDTGVYSSLSDDQALAAQTISSWDGAPSLNFQQRFLW